MVSQRGLKYLSIENTALNIPRAMQTMSDDGASEDDVNHDLDVDLR